MATLLSMKPGRLQNYNAAAQHYGEWLRGYDWQIYGCGTFNKKEVNESQAKAQLKRFFERLEKKLRASVGYYAALECRYSGLGMSAIRLHWHFLTSTTHPDPAVAAEVAQTLWKARFGDAKIDPYDCARDAAYYVTKTAMLPHCSAEHRFLPFMEYHGPDDLLEAAAQNDYVPEELKGKVLGTYLRYKYYYPAA